MTTEILAFDKFRGLRGSHRELAKKLERAGYVVEMDSENNELSFVRLPGASADIGEIRGDSEAKIV